MYFTINSYSCPQNHKCPLLKVCPVDAITQNGSGLPIIDKGKCTKCGKCSRYCGAVEIIN